MNHKYWNVDNRQRAKSSCNQCDEFIDYESFHYFRIFLESYRIIQLRDFKGFPKSHRVNSSDELHREDTHSNADQNSNEANCEEVFHYNVHHIVVNRATAGADFDFSYKEFSKLQIFLILLLTYSSQIATHQTWEGETVRNKDPVKATK